MCIQFLSDSGGKYLITKLDNLYCIWPVEIPPILHKENTLFCIGMWMLRLLDTWMFLLLDTLYCIWYVGVLPTEYSGLYRHVDVPPIGHSVLYLTLGCSSYWLLCTVSGTWMFLLLDTLYCIWHVDVPPTGHYMVFIGT